MRSPTLALLWEIWHLHRMKAAAIIGFTIAGRLLDSPAESSSLVDLLLMVSFLLLFGIFNFTESADGSAIGRFPQRLFVLPVSTLRLVAIPVLAGISSIEVLYLFWLDTLSRGGSTSLAFKGVLFGALMVFYQAALWTLDRLGPLRLLVVGALAVIVFAIGLLPSFPPNPPPLWRSEAPVAAAVIGLAAVAFLVAWRHVASLRCGGGARVHRFDPLAVLGSARLPRRRSAFSSPAAAHFWFEWRCSGLVLPLLVGGVLLVVIAPLSWLARDDAGTSLRLVLGTLATPIVLAIPVGMAFARPAFWSDDLSVPPFVAVRPLTDEDIVATKVKVAAASVLASWLLVLSFLGVWLSAWGNLDSLSQIALQWWAFHGGSIAAVYTMAALIVSGGFFLTWRCLLSRLWCGLSGQRPLFMASAMSLVVAGILAMVFAADRLPGWVLGDPERMAAVVWMLAPAVAAKYWLAAYSWRRVSPRYALQYLLLWGAGTACLLALAFMLWGVVRIYVALDIYHFQALLMFSALLAVPLGRVGLAPSSLARNRHR